MPGLFRRSLQAEAETDAAAMIQRDAVDARLAGKQIGGAEVRGGAGKLETRRQKLGISYQ